VSTVRSSDGTRIGFDRSGTGPPLILVGGAFQYRAIDESTATLVERLAPYFTVFHYDRRGRGESGDSAPYAVEREVEDLDALVGAAGGSAFVFGMSSGGALTLEAAAAGVAITKLALYEPPFAVDENSFQAPDDFLDRLRSLNAAGRPGDAVEYFLTAGLGMPGEMVAEMRLAPVWHGFEAVAHTLVYDTVLMGGQDTLLAERAPTVTAPALLLDGGASPPWAAAAVDALAAILPHAERCTLAGQTHDVAADALAPALEEFFGMPVRV
jgi:alpha-beta hydrolase superfamily lysophospholipase